MLYVHCGWPRTATTTLQTTLGANRRLLADAGLTFPERWRGGNGQDHNDLYALLQTTLRRGRPEERFKRLLTGWSGGRVLLSAEGLSNWVSERPRRAALEALLGVALEQTPTTCIWTLRRLDDALSSLYMLALKAGRQEVPPPHEAIANGRHPENPFDPERFDDLFAGLKALEEATSDVVYLKYATSGAHNVELLNLCGLPDDLTARLRPALEHGPRLNARLGQKQAATLLNVEALSARAGVKLDRKQLRQACRADTLRFESDRPCVLFDRETRHRLHERALAAAGRQGMTAYVDFFSGEQVEGPAAVQLGPEALSDADLAELRRFAALPAGQA